MAPAFSSRRWKKSNLPNYTQSSCSSSSPPSQGGGRQPQQQQQQEFNPRKIFVGGLPHETKNEHLRVLFQKYGSIVDAVVLFHPDGRPRGFGYVTFSQVESALGALADKPNHHILAQEVDAKRAVPGTNKIFVGGLHQLVTDADLRAYFSAFGEVADAYILPDLVNGRSRGFGFVSYMPGAEGAEAVDKAIAKCYHRLHGKRVEAKRAKTPHQMATEAGQARQVPAQTPTVPKGCASQTLSQRTTTPCSRSAAAAAVAEGVGVTASSPPSPPGLFEAPEKKEKMNDDMTTGEATKTLLSAMPQPCDMANKDSEEAASSPSTSVTPKDSPMMLKPLLPLTLEAAAASPSFADSPKRLTLPDGLDDLATMMAREGGGEAVKTQQSPSLSSTTSGSIVVDLVKKDTEEAASSPNTSATTTPKDSPMMLKPLLPLTPEAAAASPSFDDSPKRLTFKTAPTGFWRNLCTHVAGADAGVDAGPSCWPCSSSQRSIAHLGPPPGIFKKMDGVVETTKSQMPKHGPMLLGFEKLALTKKGK